MTGLEKGRALTRCLLRWLARDLEILDADELDLDDEATADALADLVLAGIEALPDEVERRARFAAWNAVHEAAIVAYGIGWELRPFEPTA